MERKEWAWDETEKLRTTIKAKSEPCKLSGELPKLKTRLWHYFLCNLHPLWRRWRGSLEGTLQQLKIPHFLLHGWRQLAACINLEIYVSCNVSCVESFRLGGTITHVLRIDDPASWLRGAQDATESYLPVRSTCPTINNHISLSIRQTGITE